MTTSKKSNLERRKCYDALVGLCRTWTETRTRFRTFETFSFGNCLLLASRFGEEQSTMDLVGIDSVTVSLFVFCLYLV